MDCLPDPVIGCDAAGIIVHWNRAAREAYGFAAEEALGRRAAALLQTRFPAPLLEIVEELTDLGRWEGRLTHRTKDGRTVTVESRWVAQLDQRGAHAGSVAIEREVPVVEPPASDEAPPTERPEPIGRLPGSVAHDLNSALAIIINYTAFVGEELQALNAAPTEAERASLLRDLDEVEIAAEGARKLVRRLAGADDERPPAGA